MEFRGGVAAVVAVAFGAARGPVGGPGTSKIDQLQPAGVRSNDHVGGLDIAVNDLQTTLKVADAVGKTIDQLNGL